MKTSAAGRALIEQREGRRLAAYRDTRGILTIGVGHTGRMSPPPVADGMRISEAECDAMLAADLAPVEAVIDAAVHVPVSQNEFDAMASLGFNIGATGLKRSSVVRRLNLGDPKGAAAAFMAWSRPAVLVGRRKAEAAQFLEPGEPADAAALPAARAKALRQTAATTRVKASRARQSAAALATAGMGATALVHPGHPHAALAIAVLLGAAACAAAAIAVRAHVQASTLAANAARAPNP